MRSGWNGRGSPLRRVGSTGVPPFGDRLLLPERFEDSDELHRTAAGLAGVFELRAFLQSGWRPRAEFAVGFDFDIGGFDRVSHIVDRRLGGSAMESVMTDLLQSLRQHVLQEPGDEDQSGKRHDSVGRHPSLAVGK